MKKRILISVAFLLVTAAICVFMYFRGTAVDITLSIDKTEIAVFSGEDLGIKAIAKGRYKKEVAYDVQPTVEGTVDRNHIGTYEITVSAKYAREEKKETYTIVVKDETAPQIHLNELEGYYTLPGTEYEEEGFTATDNYDGDITDRVERIAEENQVTYRVKDSSGNETTVSRAIVYTDPIAPVITLIGEADITIERRNEFTDEGATALDNCDGDLTGSITVSGEVDTLTIGDYELTYSVVDAFGNIGTAVRKVHVIERSKPIGEEVEANGKVIYLTFDDGPSIYTKNLLEVLDRYNVKATFFVCATGSTSLIPEMVEKGHTVGIHCYTHDYKTLYTSVESYKEDFFKMQDLVYELAGIRPTLFRFPGGSSNTVSRKYCKGVVTAIAKEMTELGYYYFDWNVLSGDSSGTPISTEQVYKNVINGVSGRNVSVVLQHDVKKFSVDAVESIIQWGLENGYTFLPLDETSYGAHQKIAN